MADAGRDLTEEVAEAEEQRRASAVRRHSAGSAAFQTEQKDADFDAFKADPADVNDDPIQPGRRRKLLAASACILGEFDSACCAVSGHSHEVT